MTAAPQQSLGLPQDQFLAQVRRALGRRASPNDPNESAAPAELHHPLTETMAQIEAQAAAARQRIDRELPALLDRLAATARLRGWQLCRTTSPEEAIGYIANLAADRQVAQAARSAQEVFADLPLDAALSSLGIATVTAVQDAQNSRAAVREQIIQSDLGITGADYAVAETGSVVITPRPGLSRLVSLVPPIHIAIVQPRDVVATLDDVFLFRRLEYHRNGGDMGSYLNFITGPSRTADIEQQLVVGVHGPKEVHLIILG